MTSVVVPVGRSALGKTFAAMRQWLDHKHCENATFRELATNNGLLVQVGFGDAAVASEFASQFGGATAAGDDQGLAAR
jgi:hypothetical protein